jgi:hypothetical protein
MTSNAARGNRYKVKTKQWFEKQGYHCEYLERYISRFIPGRGMFYSKKDILGSDGLAMKEDEFIFWNSKATEDLPRRRNEIVKKAAEEFAVYKFPSFVRCIVVIWELRAREPLLIEIK